MVLDQVAWMGLTADEAAARLVAEGPNELPTEAPRRLWQQAWSVLREPMLLLLVAAGAINFLLAEPLDGYLLLLTVIIVIGISIYQERKTENALLALRDLSSPRALVVRDGREVRIAGRDVVRGDVVMLAEGDRVPADAALLDTAHLYVDESALTGESVPVRKSGSADGPVEMGPPGGDATPWVFSGTLVVKGHGIAVVQRTGAHTELGRIGTALRSIDTEKTPLQREIARIVRVVAVLGIGAATAVVVIYGLTRGDWLEGLLAGIAAAMSLLPEEFPVVLAVFMALGAWRMSHKHVLTRRAPVIETLGTATVVCVDKTGTLTLNSMRIVELIVRGRRFVLDGRPLPEEFRTLAEHGLLASPVHPFDPMDRAFVDLADEALPSAEREHRDWQLVREYPLSDELLALSHAWCSPDGSRYLVASKGAPEAIAGLCHLDAGQQAELMQQVEEATAEGQRVLAVARGRMAGPGALPSDQHDFDFEFLGLVGLRDPVRPGVADAVAECRRAGVRTIMITGDYPGTALGVAQEIGLDHDAGCITGPELESMSEEVLADRIRTVNVFARMVPEQKLRLVRALRADGEIVGMTGDGVNDAPALRAADIGIAMGGRGTDVARESAGLVITDDDFGSIVSGIRQGRGIFDNLRKAMAFVVAVHVVIFGMCLVPVMGPTWPLVLLPIQIALIELIIDPACSVVFEAEEIDPRIMDQRPRGRHEAILSRHVLVMSGLQGLSVLAAVLAVFFWAVATERPDAAVRTVSFGALVVGIVALILVNRSWRLTIWQSLRQRRNRTLKWILVATAGLLVLLLAVPVLRDAFNLGATSLVDWVVIVFAGFVGVLWFEFYKVLKRLGR
jgi:P-type Ca2+ transporter type 2C